MTLLRNLDSMKVRLNGVYEYVPVLIDRIDASHNLKEGTAVRVVHQHGCPAPNTMNHCYVAVASDPKRRAVGLVCCNSLRKLARNKDEKEKRTR